MSWDCTVWQPANTPSNCVFASAALQTAFAEAIAGAQAQDLPLRLHLLVGGSAPELHSLRWKLLNNPKTGAPLGHAAEVMTVVFSPDGKTLAIGKRIRKINNPVTG